MKQHKKVTSLFRGILPVLTLLTVIIVGMTMTVQAADFYFKNCISDTVLYPSGCLKSMKIKIVPAGGYAVAYGKIAVHTQESEYDWDNMYLSSGQKTWDRVDTNFLKTNDGLLAWSEGDEFCWTNWSSSTSDGSNIVTVKFNDGEIDLTKAGTFYIYLWTRSEYYGIYTDGLIGTLTSGDGQLMAGNEVVAEAGEKVTVTFDEDGGSEIPDQEVVKGKTVRTPLQSKKQGYTLTGWTCNGQPFDLTTPVNEAITLKAVWTVSNNILEENADSDSEGIPTGWTVQSNNDGLKWIVGVGDHSESTGTHSGDHNFKITHKQKGAYAYLISPEMDLSSYPKASLSFWFINRSWSGDTDTLDVCYRIKNGSDYGSWISMFSTNGNSHSQWTEETIDLPQAALASGVQIGFKMTDGWGYGVGLDDIVLSGVPSVSNDAYITFYSDMEGNHQSSAQKAALGTKLSELTQPADPSKEGYYFAGWTTVKAADTEKGYSYKQAMKDSGESYILSDFSDETTETVTKDMKLYPVFIKDRLEVHLDLGACDTTDGSASYTFPAGESTPSWYSEKQSTYAQVSNSTKATMAAEQSRQFTVNIDEKIRMLYVDDQGNVDSDKGMLKATRQGYDLAGWYTQKGVLWNGVNWAAATSEDKWVRMTPEYADKNTPDKHISRPYNYYTVTLTAHWTPKTVTVSYSNGDHADAGSGEISGGSANTELGSTLTLPVAPTPATNYEFTGWKIGNNETLHSAGEIITFDDWSLVTDGDTPTLKVTAQYMEKSSISVTFDTQGGSAIPPAVVQAGTPVNKPADPTKEGYRFTGWFKMAEDGEEVTFPLNNLTENLTVYAHWTPVQYTIEFIMNGATTPTQIEPIRGYYGDNIQTTETPIRAHYDFMGWSPSLPTTMPAHNLTVEALWQPKTYYVVFKKSSEDVGEKIGGIYGSLVVPSATPAADHVTFVEWSMASPIYMPDTGTYANPTVITARWKPNPAITGETSLNKGDGKASGVTTEMQYRKEGVDTWTDVPAETTELTNLEAGKYQIRYKPTEETTATYKSDAVTEFTINRGQAIQVNFKIGDAAYQTQAVAYGAALTKPETPVSDGFLFDGWYADSNYSSPWDFTTKVYADRFLYGRWVEIAAPVIKTQPQDITIEYRDRNATHNRTLSVEVQAEDNSVLSYQWYQVIEGNIEDKNILIPGATKSSYTIPPDTEVSAHKYYCVVTKTVNNANSVGSISVSSNTVSVTVTKSDPIVSAPVGKTNLTYSGRAQKLVSAGEAAGGTMYYALGDEQNPPEFDGTSEAADKKWNTSIPTATNAGTYYVWYKVVGDENHNDTDAACITATISNRPTGGGSTTITIPVEGDTNESAAKVTALTGEKASIETVKEETFNKVASENTTVTMDLTGLKKNGRVKAVTTVSLSKATVDNLLKSNANELEIKLTSGTILIDEKTLQYLEQNAAGSNIDLVIVVEEPAEKTLTDKQAEAVKDMKDVLIVEAYFTSNGQRIRSDSFNGGTVRLTVAYETDKPVNVWYLDNAGNLNKLDASWKDGLATWAVDHLSHFVIQEKTAQEIEDDQKASEVVKQINEADTDEKKAAAYEAYEELTGDQKAIVEKTVGDEKLQEVKDAKEAVEQAGADVDEFEAYKARKKGEAEALAQAADSAETKKLISDAAADIATLLYDNTKDLAGNKARVDAIYEKLLTDIAGSRAAKKEGQEQETVNRLDQKGEDGTPLGEGASFEAADEAILAMKDDNDPAGSMFCKLRLTSPKQTKTSIRLKWKKPAGTVRFVLYGNKCGIKNRMKRLGTYKKTSTNMKKVLAKKIKKATYYKFIIVALDRKNNVISTSKVIHVATKGGKAKNNTGLKLKSAARLTLKAGKTSKIKAKALGSGVKKHVGLRYESSKTTVATVTKTGRIKAVRAGSCKVYVYTQNGKHKTIKVTVKR